MADKQELARIFAEVAVLLELKGENPFKIRAYETAARILEELDGDLEDFVASGRMDATKGIGQALGLKIREFLADGRVKYFEELKAAVPAVLFELVKIPGLGPKKALQLYEKLGVNSIGELEYACRENRLVALPGFGAKTQERILQGIDYVKRFQGQFLLVDAWPLAEKAAAWLEGQPGVDRAAVAGSIRRRKETVKDIDVVVAAADPAAATELVAAMPGVEAVLGRGPTKTSVRLANGMNMDVRAVMPEEFAAALHHFTGSKEHHVGLRGLAKDKGLKINEYGIETAVGERLPVPDEAAFYRMLGLAYIEPELREGLGEIEAAAGGTLPELVTARDIQGVFHVHTTFSDGSATPAEMAAAARERGWGYLGVSDHSRTAVYARGLRLETVAEQRREIERLNAANPDFRLMAAIECDILPDGSLDYPDEVLAEFDFVIASVHSAFRQSEADMTRRIIRAMENRYVGVLGHPTGRILLARDGYGVDLGAVIAAAATTGTVIEINASPYRLDLDWRWCRKAKETGVLLAVNPDAHAPAELDYVRYGVAVARKGWLSAADIVNTRPAAEAMALLRRKRA
ncbi:DNA polymerase/3'-5' exonuclease PolX [Anaeroselena agilis]|uniref:DNA-directed DNA polymerase n=1 Tax=Anaeroselena agilis TaxID=3063788 RepID=A0ABU3P254_9FIRM|nr:DNA polymerase/3'-5' exonuclease PolX [Selenomonadales bacterium 4137-cl]